MNISAREKFLIILLAAVVILLGGFKLLIEPQMKNLNAANADLLKAISEKILANDNLKAEESIEKQNAELSKKIDEASKSFFPELENDKIQLFFQNLAQESGIDFDTFTMADKTATQITVTRPIDASLNYPIKDAVNNLNSIQKGEPAKASGTAAASAASKETKTEEKKQPADLVEMMAVTMQFKGTYEQSLSLIDAIAKSGRTVRIISADMTADDKGVLTTNISVECFGVVKASDYDGLSKDSLASPQGKTNPFQ